MRNWAFHNSCYPTLSDMTHEKKHKKTWTPYWPVAMIQKTIFSTILSQFNLVHAHITYFINFSFDITLLSYVGIPSSHFSTNLQNKIFDISSTYSCNSYFTTVTKPNMSSLHL